MSLFTEAFTSNDSSLRDLLSFEGGHIAYCPDFFEDIMPVSACLYSILTCLKGGSTSLA